VILMLIMKKKAMEEVKVSWFAHLLNIQVHDDNIDQRKQLQQHLKNIIMTSKAIFILPIDMCLHKWSHLLSW
jgi:hypothetical protein